MRKRKPAPKLPAPKPTPKPTPTPKAAPGDFVDKRNPGRQYTQDMIDYIDPATGEITSRTRGIVPAPGSRFVPLRGFSQPGRLVGAYDAAMAQQVYQNLLAQSLQQANLFNDYMNQGMGINNALTAATSGQTMGTMPQQTAGTIPQQQIPIQMPAVQQSQQPTQFGQVNQQAMQNFNNLVQNGISQANANQNNPGDMYRSLQPPFAQIGPARPKPNPMISQNFGSIASGIGNIMPKTPKPF